ncbi:hypothetical protein LES60_20140 [Pectobacterium brasiliense]|uniref:hypothetical protein n=1 Tax=Pectobacterium brasiliense TaxID=180957 RepID=UPI001CE03261|nr:hypothetical protein [Pectobacterium brasiliense]MCA5921798.1 hypothetical protein [Pectobacterium brasiliense]MCA5928965.1 hypothetical protein [Pectobacterium brasiliense]MCA5937822.1 hypothetical protein [Pectobacterium brasiliense]MCA5942006.1 hypothetical protein [Pectobacterium brasiliense]MCA5946118.1 hypothetical protein [Pectobacterium brasiliense]
MFSPAALLAQPGPSTVKKRADERILARVNRLSTGIPEVRVAGEEAGGSFSAPHNSGGKQGTRTAANAGADCAESRLLNAVVGG